MADLFWHLIPILLGAILIVGSLTWANVRWEEATDATKARIKDLAGLFAGGLVQWAVATAVTRFAVLDGPLKLAAAVFMAQTIWWINIQNTTRSNRVDRWFTWSAGAAIGAVIGLILTS